MIFKQNGLPRFFLWGNKVQSFVLLADCILEISWLISCFFLRGLQSEVIYRYGGVHLQSFSNCKFRNLRFLSRNFALLQFLAISIFL